MAKRIAVIGSGASGLTAIKCCLDEGLEPVCFERTDHMGGLWHYTDEVHEGQACVMKSTVINTSKEVMSYSDFPIPAEFSVFMHNKKVKEYFDMYSKHIGAERYTQFNTEVLEVKQATDFAESGQWQVTVQHGAETRTELFDGVLVCTGHHADKNVPTFEGLDKFQGTVIHSHDYRHSKGFENKRVLVVGIGNSGGDVAVELSRLSEQVFISTRRGTWVFNRIGPNGYPGDLVSSRRYTDMLNSYIPRSITLKMMERRLNSKIDHKTYGLKPNHSPFSQHPLVNDDFTDRLASGTIKIKPDVRRFRARGVEFVDGSVEDNIDAVILATGYKFGFPFIKHDALKVEGNKVDLYKYVFPPDIKPATLAVVGFVQPLGAIMPISEIQCRWATRVFNGSTKLPSVGTMKEDIEMKKVAMKARYAQSQRHTIQVDYINYMDQIAVEFGVKPNLGKLFWSDPELALRCFFGSFTPYQYRLMGPGQWDGARQAIMTLWDRTLAGVSTSKSPPTKGIHHPLKYTTNLALATAVLLVFLAIFIKFVLSCLCATLF